MEEAKAADYYDELSRKGEGAARFKQGLGFSSSSSSSSSFPTTRTNSSSLLSSFVRASSPTGKVSELERQAQIQKIHNKLNKNPHRVDDTASHGRSGDRRDGRRSSGERGERDDEIGRQSDKRRRRRCQSPGYSGDERIRRGKDEEGRRNCSNASSSSSSHDRGSHSHVVDRIKSHKGRGGAIVDYSLLIHGYSQMTPAERVKAKMKYQLSQTVANDTSRGMHTGWERFDFNKDAPLDDDLDEMEAAEDDASLVKHIGKSFRFSALEAKREEEVKVAHDQAMFGAPASSPALEIGSTTEENDAEDTNEKDIRNVLISDQMLSKQQGSWRDRARRFQNGTGN